MALTTSCAEQTKDKEQAEEPKKNLVYGIDADLYTLKRGEVDRNETMGGILNRLGVSAKVVDQLNRQSADIFPLKNIRAGNKYTAFLSGGDSINQPKLEFLAYESSKTDYVVFGFGNDTTTIQKGEKEFRLLRTKKSAIIESSLWGAIMEQDLPYVLAAEMEDIYQWSVDFFGIQKGDKFTVIYDERFIDDTVSVGVGRIWGAKFSQGDATYYAIPFYQSGRVQYWEADGASLRKQMLRAPLKYSRISSGFSYSRLHPIHRVYRPHTGVDYAAPSGTPVHSVADGVVTFRAYKGAAGNMIKIKHANKIETGYLHLRGYAKGLRVGSRVKQGQLIGYVGSTGGSTGPHLDYRVWRNGVAINPLKIPQKPSEPISKANSEAFEYVKGRIMAELDDSVTVAEPLTELDSVAVAAMARAATASKDSI